MRTEFSIYDFYNHPDQSPYVHSQTTLLMCTPRPVTSCALPDQFPYVHFQTSLLMCTPIPCSLVHSPTSLPMCTSKDHPSPPISECYHFIPDLSTYYLAESLSWYSLDLLKQSWTPLSVHSLFMAASRSSVNGSVSSILDMTSRISLASACSNNCT